MEIGGITTNMFGINRTVFVFEITGGLPILTQHRVIRVDYIHGRVYYDLESLKNEEDVITLCEEYIFSSIEEATQVFNEGQDQFILTIKKETKP